MLDAASLFGRSVSPHHGAVALWAASGVVASSTSSGARADALARLYIEMYSGGEREKTNPHTRPPRGVKSVCEGQGRTRW